MDWRGAIPAMSVPDEPGREARGTVFLQPGHWAACADGTRITTILGSCVAVCLWDPRRRQGGMNHYLLPDWAGVTATSARYADAALRLLLAQLLAMGSVPAALEAKLFGGASVLEPLRDKRRPLGLQNVEAGRRLVAAAGVALVAEDTGGDRGRKLVFDTDDGSAYVRRL